MSNLLPTAPCSRCYMHFRLHNGYIRGHDDVRGNRCPGSGLKPWEPLLSVWWKSGGAA